jgi:pSer/pThr/pTyr-binding forkhead associated (FHA) protein
LKSKEAWVGRADSRQGINPDIDLTDLVDGDTVSRRHARLMLRQGSFYVQDMGSSYGTWVNEREITGEAPAPLQPGDRVRFGEVRLTFQWID